MATKAITVRLEESTIKWLDDLAEAFAHRWRASQDPFPLPGSQAFGEAALTRSDMIRVCITGYLSDHDAALVRLHDEMEAAKERS